MMAVRGPGLCLDGWCRLSKINVEAITVRRIKFGTAIDAALLAIARAIAAKEHKHLNTIIEESLEQYLASKDLAGQLCAVQGTGGAAQGAAWPRE